MSFLINRVRRVSFVQRFAVIACLLVVPVEASAEDWSAWMGDAREGVYLDETIIEEIPGSGLPVLWRTPIAGGYAGPSVSNGKVYVFDFLKQSGEAFNDPGKRATLSGSERLICLDQETGKELWVHQYECPYSVSYPAGPRCTPTVDGDLVYSLGSEGDLRCLKAETGDLVWSRSFKDDFNAEVPIWGFASHPLIDGDLLYTMVGGDGQGIVAFDKRTGDVRWKKLDTTPGYCAPCIIEAAGKRQLLIYHPHGVDSMNPENGDSYWNVEISPAFDMSIARPMRDENLLYVSGIRTESVMLRMDENTTSVSELWRGERGTSVFCSNSTPMFVDGVVYGTDCNEGNLIAVDAKTGDRIWTTFQATRPEEKRFVKHGTAFITRIGATDRYLLFSEMGDLIMAKLTRQGYKELGRFHAVEPTSEAFGRDVVWSHPAYADQTAFIRNDKEIIAVSLKR
ncbi:PQQ-like domain-containing protein [Neorhodopirellula lusitana]|uniref:PQQ-like domain-containing protein n=2 Tax=Neorhodopirellula lusitana TaxID=445327 RepID=A0ABY1PTN9_9BACT|nr:PQQ-like domain-containing protein [Neorhodopirellula lusitana]